MNVQWVVKITVGSSGLFVLHGPFKTSHLAGLYAAAYAQLNPGATVTPIGLFSPEPGLLPPR